MNRKRVSRIYREERLSLRLKRRRKRSASVRVPFPVPTRPNEVWALDFVHDRLAGGRAFKALVIFDEFTREVLAIIVDFGIGGKRVTEELAKLIDYRGKPDALRMDNGPEFVSNDVDAWAYHNGVKLDFIRPGKPNENAMVESFNGRFRDECLNDNQFRTLIEAQIIIETWRKDYNNERPHGSLDGKTPTEFAEEYEIMLKRNGTKKPQLTPA